jgi:hypothetical protein
VLTTAFVGPAAKKFQRRRAARPLRRRRAPAIAGLIVRHPKNRDSIYFPLQELKAPRRFF